MILVTVATMLPMLDCQTSTRVNAIGGPNRVNLKLTVTVESHSITTSTTMEYVSNAPPH